MRGRQGIKQRQRSALELLQAQLKRGTKPERHKRDVNSEEDNET